MDNPNNEIERRNNLQREKDKEKNAKKRKKILALRVQLSESQTPFAHMYTHKNMNKKNEQKNFFLSS